MKNRRKLVEDKETKVEEFPRKREPTHLKKWQDIEKGKEREERSSKEKENLELKNSPAGTKLAKIFRKKENLKKMAKSGELNSLLDGTSPLKHQVRPVIYNANQLVVQEREGNSNSANRNVAREPASSKLRWPSVVIGGTENSCDDQWESRNLPRKEEEK